MSRIRWTDQFVLNKGIDETHSPQQISPAHWSSGTNVEPMPDGVRRRLGSSAENSTALELISIGHDAGTDSREMTDGSTEYVSQGFITVGALSVSRVAVRLRKTSGDSPTGNVHAAIYTDDASGPPGEPNTVVSGADFTDFGNIDSSTLPTSFEWQFFVLSTAVTLSATTTYHLVIRHLGATAGDTIDIEEVTTPSGFATEAVNTSTDASTWVGVDAADLNFRIYDSVASITMIADYRLADASTSRHLVFAGGELYKNVSGTMTSVSASEAIKMTQSATTFPSWAVGQDRFFLTNNTEISKKFYVLSGTEYWENEGIATPTAALTLGAGAGTALDDGVYYVDYYYWNNDLGIPSNRKYAGVADTSNDTPNLSTQHITISGIPAAVVRPNDRATHIRFELKELGSSVFRFAKEITIGTTSTTITSSDLPTLTQGEYNHNVPGLHQIKCVAENRQFILDVVDASSNRFPTRLMFSSINGTTPYYESFGVNNTRDFGQGDGDYGTALFFMPPRTLIVGFKNSIYAIDARRPATSDKVQISKEVGIAAHNSGRVTGGKLFFFSDSAENVGSYVWAPGMAEPQLLRGIDNTLKSLSTSRFKYASVATFAPGDDRYQFWIMLTTTKILVFDYNLKAWTVYEKPTGREGNVLGVVESSGIDAVYFGGDDGVEYKHDTGSDDAGTGYTGVLTTGALDYGMPNVVKRHRWVKYLVEINTSGAISLSTVRDYGDRGGIAASLSHSLLGSGTSLTWGTTPAWGTAIWGANTNSKRQVSLRGAGEVFEHTLSSGDAWYLKGIQYGYQSTGRN